MQPELPPAVVRWLTNEGLPIVEEVTQALDAGRSELAVGSSLRGDHDPAHAAAAVAAGVARQRARADGVPLADRLLLTRVALEQASRPEVSAHRAERFAGRRAVVDLCAGAGLDTVALGGRVDRVLALDLDPSRAALLDHNARACGVAAAVVVGDAARPPFRFTVPVHADPSRRDGQRRARRLADYQPSLPALLAATASAPGRGIVISPGVDWDDRALPYDAELEFIQVGGDLVEAMLWLGELRRPGVRATATVLPGGGSRTRRDDPAPLPVAPVGEWLIEMAPAAVRARVHDELGRELGAHRVARSRALLSAAVDPGPSPWWQVWQVETVLPARPREVRRWLRGADPIPIEITTHGLEADPVAWWRALGSPPRGPTGRRLHLVRTDDGALCIVTVST